MRTRLFTLSAGVVLLGINFVSLSAADWTHYRGPAGDGLSPEKWPLGSWPTNGLHRLWRTPVETGFSSFTIADGKAFTVVARSIEGENREACLALDAATGKELWATPFGIARYDKGGDSGTPDNKGGDGPRSTPVFNDGRIYLYSSRMNLVCLDVKSGQTVWTQDIEKDFGGQNIRWQSAASPVVDGDLVFVVGGGAGQSLLGFDKKTGANVWKAESDGLVHATPVVATIQGVRQAIFFTKQGLVTVAPKTGTVLWRHAVEISRSAAASPVVSGDLVYCSAGYGVGASVVRIKKDGEALQAQLVWRKANQLMNHWSTPVCKDGYIYGMFGHAAYGKAPLCCIELATGEEKWSKPGFGMGNVTLVEDRLVALADNGELVVLKATPTACTEEGRFEALDGKCWSTPAFSNGKLYLRSTTEGACYAVAE